ncbi:MAG: branched-chain amino acid ABC transporter permease [Gammaproteobacteria bacterium]|nr:MAG: branched-chain amino acid ABC transporter permease [Gammaproteobacteria bacterium]
MMGRCFPETYLMNYRTRQFWLGALETLPLILAAFPFGIVFGALANSNGLTFAITAGMSSMVFAGASQFIAITLLANGTALPVIVLTVFIINLRQMLYSANLMHHVAHWPRFVRAVLAFWLTDETFATVSDRINRHPEEPGLRWFYLGSALFMYSFWLFSTILGYTLGSQIPGLSDWGLDVAMIVALVGIVTPALKLRADWACAAVAFISSLLTFDWPQQSGLLFSSILAICVGMLLSRSGKTNE